MKVFITGAGGYIASIASQMFLKAGHQVIGIDSCATGYELAMKQLKDDFPQSFHYVVGTIADKDLLDKVFTEHRDIDAVLHYAASAVVKESMQQPEKYFKNNVGGSLVLLEAMRTHDIKTIIFSSTCAVYGDAQYFPIDEKHPCHPSNPYGESKLMVEQMLKWYSSQYGFKVMMMRYFNVYGSSDDARYGYAKKPVTHLVDAAVQAGLGLHTFTLTCSQRFATPDGTPIRDYLHVVDLNEAHMKAVELAHHSKIPLYEAINLGTGKGDTVLSIVEAVEKQLDVQLPRAIGEVRTGEDARLVADIRKADELLGWKPKRTLSHSLPLLITWYKNHPKGWDV